jgi:transcription elongation factor GreA
MEGRIRQLEHIIENAEIIEGGDEGVVGTGSIVTIVYEGDDDSMAERYSSATWRSESATSTS